MTSDNSQDIRWKQRFVHFRKAFLLLEQTMTIAHPSEAERAGLIQFFEMSFELAWKVLKDCLEAEGFTGRKVILKKARISILPLKARG
jgi:hypothetical protein